eukprot:CAMPEP_0168244120 /NCGR_PEP_ID=MMETSP0140_2-20121125/24437_1 /TAXON_ID=44445 /ORGANISM="Pseudo-nitzschia australis, Strain 10249 10 AB" /LENGTH=452 /DNA_ID=CAMNT_0008179573 /DNA_START=18 /DNA_END=1373 /DNA_ORIENTATION=-
MAFDDTYESASNANASARVKLKVPVKVKTTNTNTIVEQQGRSSLMKAIREKNVKDIKLALLFLSTTKLATKEKEKKYNRNININRNSNHDDEEIITINVCGTNTKTTNYKNSNALLAAIGPDPVHTEMVRCLLTPQSLYQQVQVEEVEHQEEQQQTYTTTTSPSTAIVVTTSTIIATNAAARLLEVSGDVRNPGLTPLAIACQCNNTSLVRLLLDFGANPNACNLDGDRQTPLIRMAKVGNLNVIKVLLTTSTTSITSTSNKFEYGTDVYRYDQQAMSALIHACTEDHLEVAQYLVNAVGGGRFDSRGSDGGSNDDTQRIVATSSTVVADFVNDYKVDPPLWYASAHGNHRIVQFLMDDCGAKANYRATNNNNIKKNYDPNVYSSTPLMEASEWGHVAVVELLLEREGSYNSMNATTATGQKARALAARAGYTRVVEWMDLWTSRLKKLEEW